MDDAIALYTLLPGIQLGQMGPQNYLYDEGLGPRRLLRYGTMPISAQERDALVALRDLDFPVAFDAIQVHLDSQGITGADAASLLKIGLLIEYGQDVGAAAAGSFVRGLYADRFEQRDKARVVTTETFFNVPRDLGAATPHVGIKGMPLASISKNKGTEAAPDFLRHFSGSFANWFEIYRDGVYSDLCLGHGKPTIGHDLVLADFGDLVFRDDSLADIFARIDRSIHEEFLAPGIKPIFVGGDHAVTFPIVESLHKSIPDLGLLHLDAHHDVLFGDHIQYSHASVISNLIFHTGIEEIFSFGLRSRADLVGPQTADLLRLPHARKWWSQASTITDCRRYILSPSLLDDVLDDVRDRPFFLTLDLDVLSPEAISGRVMTPVPDGLSWSELFVLLDALFERVNIIGCDITELNPYFGSANEQTNEALCLLLLYLVERLGR